MIDFVLLGSGGMMPLPDRWLSSLLVRCRGELILFDCGEGTQIPWRQIGWGFRRLGTICLSHLHADHVAGLPGLLHTLANSGRQEPVLLYGPPGTAAVVAGLRTIVPDLPYDLQVRELRDEARAPLPAGLVATVAAGEHRLPVLGYRVDLARSPRFSPERAEALGIPLALWRDLQAGRGVSWPGGSATPEQVLGPPRRGLAFAFVTDTRPRPTFIPFLAEVDLLVCEGTYGDPADGEKAVKWGHMTFAEAATLAREARTGALWLTHFSPALTDPALFLEQATRHFAATTLGVTGLTTTLNFPD